MAKTGILKRPATRNGISDDIVTSKSAVSGEESRPAKRAKLLAESSESEDERDAEPSVFLKVNEEYARRFEHNKKREEKQRLEEKYGKTSLNDVESEESSDSETEDEGELMTETMDADIVATLQAIRNKDPRIFDKTAKFYYEDGGPVEKRASSSKIEKPMYLKDYHRRNILEGNVEDNGDDNVPPHSFAEEQNALKRNIVNAVHAKAYGEADSDSDDFLQQKKRPTKPQEESRQDKMSRRPIELDVANADKDPETFLSNFLLAREWKPSNGSAYAPIESDDEEDERRADEFEEAYNMRFEKPEESNAKLLTHSRETVAKYSVRRDDTSGRKKARESKRSKKDAEKLEQEEEKARLRKLKVEEMKQKVKSIKEAAGARGLDFDLDDWIEVLEQEWDDDKWDEEMNKRFGDTYYGAEDHASSEDGEMSGSKKKKKKKEKKVEKPTWDDDIDIKDLIPDFSDGENMEPTFSVSENDHDDAVDVDNGDGDDADEDKDKPGADSDVPSDLASSSGANVHRKPKKPTKKARLHAAADEKRKARRDRRIIESLVDASADLALPPSIPTSSSAAAATAATAATGRPRRPAFRYRETSPTALGLTPRDILLATDAQLNEYAGLKRLTAFRDPERKEKERRKYSKKKRLKQWRKVTFGDSREPTGGFERLFAEPGGLVEEREKERGGGAGGEAGEGETKKKRRRKKKAKSGNVEV